MGASRRYCISTFEGTILYIACLPDPPMALRGVSRHWKQPLPFDQKSFRDFQIRWNITDSDPPNMRPGYAALYPYCRPSFGVLKRPTFLTRGFVSKTSLQSFGQISPLPAVKWRAVNQRLGFRETPWTQTHKKDPRRSHYLFNLLLASVTKLKSERDTETTERLNEKGCGFSWDFREENTEKSISESNSLRRLLSRLLWPNNLSWFVLSTAMNWLEQWWLTQSKHPVKNHELPPLMRNEQRPKSQVFQQKAPTAPGSENRVRFTWASTPLPWHCVAATRNPKTVGFFMLKKHQLAVSISQKLPRIEPMRYPFENFLDLKGGLATNCHGSISGLRCAGIACSTFAGATEYLYWRHIYVVKTLFPPEDAFRRRFSCSPISPALKTGAPIGGAGAGLPIPTNAGWRAPWRVRSTRRVWWTKRLREKKT